MSRATALREHDVETDADGIVVLHGVSWEDYERLLEIRGDHSAPRISYLEGEVEIMSPSRDHEQIKSYIGHLLEAWCIDRGIEVHPFGSWTVKEEKKKSGAEPDECYIFGREPREWPQLAIEVEWTQRGIEKLEIYRKFGVEEVWYWRKGIIEVYILTRGRFAKAKRSRVLPDLDLELLASMLDRDSLTQAVRDFRAAQRPISPKRPL
ncbi:MAG TPA: Uma2 family endonuclease [Thermoanaerobaculia bacterium]|nr:Uma2 family endonuclease [Thermoanaerobaculia bacterium]